MTHALLPRQSWARKVAGTIMLALGLVTLMSPGSARAAGGGVRCTIYGHLPVALDAGQKAAYDVSGELCATPAELRNGETVQLLVHGATYNRRYWNFGTVDETTYSYARDVARAGFPTFAFDEVGSGASAHPPSTEITIQVAAYVEHQVVAELRGGMIGHVRFGNVIEVGHSFGSITSWVEASTYRDVEGVILTGLLHSSTVFAATAPAVFEEAIDDPVFAGSGLDSGYLTTTPGTRAALFYSALDSDPEVVTADEASKDVFSATEFASGDPLITATISEGIRVPVLLIDGSDDALFCGALVDGGTEDCSTGAAIAAAESGYYSPIAQLRACSVPGSGHDINLALNHVMEEADATVWSYEYVGQRAVGVIDSRVLPPSCS